MNTVASAAVRIVDINDFDVGELRAFACGTVSDTLIDQLATHTCFEHVPHDYIAHLKSLFPLIKSCVDAAMCESDNEMCNAMCEMPKKQLKDHWKLRSDTCVNAEEHRKYTIMKNECIEMYYCLYVILFWRHPLSIHRYADKIIAYDAFHEAYKRDSLFIGHNLEKTGSRMDKWKLLFQYRNVLMLAVAVKPQKRNKNMFSKVASILAEGRVHTTGGGQSFASDRRNAIYMRECDCFGSADDSDTLSHPDVSLGSSNASCFL